MRPYDPGTGCLGYVNPTLYFESFNAGKIGCRIHKYSPVIVFYNEVIIIYGNSEQTCQQTRQRLGEHTVKLVLYAESGGGYEHTTVSDIIGQF